MPCDAIAANLEVKSLVAKNYLNKFRRQSDTFLYTAFTYLLKLILTSNLRVGFIALLQDAI